MEPEKKNGTLAADAATIGSLEQMKKLLGMDPGNAQLARHCVDLALEAHDFAFVLERAGHTLATAPDDVQSLFDRASALIGLTDYRAAVESLSAVLLQKASLPAALINLGLCHFCLGEYASARTPLDAAYAGGDRSIALLRLLISTCHHLGLVDEAVALCEASGPAAAADGALAGACALVYLDAEQAKPAAKWAASALARNPGSLEGLVVSATLSALSMDTERAKAQFQRALEVAPATGRAWVGLGSLALLEKDFPRAKQQLSRALEHMPTHLGSWQALGWTHLLSSDLEAADSAFRHALTLDDTFAETHGGLASVAALRGNREEADRAIKVALRLDPNCFSAQFARSVLLRNGRDAAQAHKIITDTVARLSLLGGGALLSAGIARATRH